MWLNHSFCYLDQNLEVVGQAPCKELDNHPGAPIRPQISHCPSCFLPSVPTDSHQPTKPKIRKFASDLIHQSIIIPL